MNTSVKIKYNSLNTLKGLACIGVIYLHCPFPGEIGKLVLYVFKFAVPIFFMISGYFLYNANQSNIKQKITRQLSKITKILLVSILIYGIFDLICSCFVTHAYSSIGDWLSFAAFPDHSVFGVIKTIVFGTLFNNTLWYFHALIFAYLIIGPIIKRVSINWLIAIIFLLFIVHISSRIYCKAMYFDWYEANYWRSFLLTALPWMLTGYVCAAYREWICTHISLPIILTMIVMGYCCQLLEYKIYNQSLSFYFGTIAYCIAIFWFGIKYPEKKYSRAINFIGEKLSLYIYIAHYGVIVIFNDLMPRNIIINAWSVTIISVLVSILLSYLYYFTKGVASNLHK